MKTKPKITAVAKTTERAMTTNSRATPKRRKHTARSARILTTGISVASVLGLTSAYALAAQRVTLASVNEPTAAPDANQLVAALAAASIIAPTQPAPAIPATTVVLAQAAPVAQTSPAAATQVQAASVAQTPPAAVPITILVPQPAATRSSGSK